MKIHDQKRFRKNLILSLMGCVLAIIILIHYNTLYNFSNTFLETQIQNWGYQAIFVSVFILELIPQPLLSGLVPFATGMLFDLSFWVLLCITIIASIIANYTAYFLGIQYGEPIAHFFVSKKNYNRSIVWFQKHGKKSITLLALTPLPYFPIMGGIFKMTFREFTLYAIIPRILHFTIFSYLILMLI